MNKLNFIVDYLGKPYYRNDHCLIYHGNCLDLLDKLPKNIIDLTITSPPYNIGKDYERVLPINEYLEFISFTVKKIYNITKENGAFWLNLGYVETERTKAIPLPYLLWDKIDFYLIQEIVWNYGAGVACKTRFSPRNEKFLWYVKDKDDYFFDLDAVRDKNVKYPNQKKNGKLKCNPNGKNPSDVWQISKVTSGTNRSSKERTKHPAQFPVELISRIIKSSSKEKDLILDCFMGSGSTCLAAALNNRLSIGFEIREDYCKIAKDRLQS